MTNRMPTVIDRMLAGEQLNPGALLDAVDEWHEGDSPLPLHEFLGFTWDEYVRWAVHPEQLQAILAERSRA